MAVEVLSPLHLAEACLKDFPDISGIVTDFHDKITTRSIESEASKCDCPAVTEEISGGQSLGLPVVEIAEDIIHGCGLFTRFKAH